MVGEDLIPRNSLRLKAPDGNVSWGQRETKSRGFGEKKRLGYGLPGFDRQMCLRHSTK